MRAPCASAASAGCVCVCEDSATSVSLQDGREDIEQGEAFLLIPVEQTAVGRVMACQEKVLYCCYSSSTAIE